jgi:hypothetical protein
MIKKWLTPAIIASTALIIIAIYSLATAKQTEGWSLLLVGPSLVLATILLAIEIVLRYFLKLRFTKIWLIELIAIFAICILFVIIRR